MIGNVNERLEGGADIVDAAATSDSFKEPLPPGPRPRDDSTPAGIRMPLKTPEKRHLSLEEEEGSAPEVRKRPLYSRLMSLSPPTVEVVEVKQQQRHVSKILFGSGSGSTSSGKKLGLGGGGGVARCMFGGPTLEQNAAVMRACEEKIRQNYERFSKRWVVVDGEESPYEI